MFNRRKPPSGPAERNSLPRGRESEPGESQPANPLARRFLDQGEPATVDLAEPGRFHAPGDDAEPETADTLAAGSGPAAVGDAAESDWLAVVSLDPRTGKYYIHPGADNLPVTLGDEPVTAPTELRKGDRIRIGSAEFEFLR